jgi:DNA-directed RNA polymerase sigma subunit (sigma70/sigma32)
MPYKGKESLTMKALAASCNDTIHNPLPPLSSREEAVLCRRWHEHHDVTAAGRLIGSHLHMIAEVAMAHRGCGVPMQELIGEGYVGLVRAACRYDPECGTRFAAYATWSVRAAIQESILRAVPWIQRYTADVETATLTLPRHVRSSRQRSSAQFVP